jgi:hypothetical protein
MIDETLTHIQIVLLDANASAMLYSTTAPSAEETVEQFRQGAAAVTVYCDNGVRFTFQSAKILAIEQMTAEVAQARIDASAKALKEREEAALADAARRVITPRGGSPLR